MTAAPSDYEIATCLPEQGAYRSKSSRTGLDVALRDFLSENLVGSNDSTIPAIICPSPVGQQGKE